MMIAACVGRPSWGRRTRIWARGDDAGGPIVYQWGTVGRKSKPTPPPPSSMTEAEIQCRDPKNSKRVFHLQCVQKRRSWWVWVQCPFSAVGAVYRADQVRLAKRRFGRCLFRSKVTLEAVCSSLAASPNYYRPVHESGCRVACQRPWDP